MKTYSRRDTVRLFALAAAFVGVPSLAYADQAAAHEIVHLLKATFDRPGAPLSVDPVVVVGEHSVAGWAQEGRGGRALMRKVHGKWTVHLCSGDSLKDAAVLKDTGIAAGDAAEIAKQLASAEAKLPKETVALFGTFEGTVMVGASGHHPPAHAAGHDAKHK